MSGGLIHINRPKLRTPIRPNLKPTSKDRLINVTGRQPAIQSPIKGRVPTPGKTPILTGPKKSPIVKGRIPSPGKSPIVTRPGKLPLPAGPIKGRLPGKGRIPGQSGDPDAGNPVKPLPSRGDAAKIERPNQGILPGDTPPVIDEPIDSPYPEQGNDGGNNNGNQGGNLQEGDVTSGNGKVIDQEFLDLINEGEFLHYGQPAPWDNPDDPFWNQEKPQDWKGYWPGGPPKDPIIPPTNPGDDGWVPPYEPPVGTPPGDHIPPYCPPPIVIIDPIGPPPVVCPPCVTTVCRPAVVAPVEIVEEEPVQQVLQLVTDRQNTLMVEGFGNVAGNAALQVNGLGLPLKVAWTNEKLVLDVPMIGMVEPTPAKLYLFDAEMNVLAELDVELLTPEMAGLENPAE